MTKTLEEAKAFLGDRHVFATPQVRLDRRPDPNRPIPEYLRRQDDHQESQHPAPR